MPVEFNHTIVWSGDSKASAAFLAGILGLPPPRKWGPFHVVATSNGVNLDFMEGKADLVPTLRLSGQRDRNSTKSSTASGTRVAPTGPTRRGQSRVRSIRHDGGRGVYFEDPNGHLLEIITRPYGSSGWEPLTPGALASRVVGEEK